MQRIARSALVPFPAEYMYALVNDVEHYPEFLPWCTGVEVKSRDASAVVATLELRRAGIRQHLTTRNLLEPPKRLRLELVDGPFRRFEGVWEFLPLASDACKVSLDLDFEYSGRLMRMALGPFFDRAADTLVDAFCSRVRDLHGRAPESDRDG